MFSRNAVDIFHIYMYWQSIALTASDIFDTVSFAALALFFSIISFLYEDLIHRLKITCLRCF